VCRLVASLLLAISLVFSCEPSFCAEAGPLVISVPPGFEGPTRDDSNGGVTVAWIERQPVPGGGTLLQVSAIDVGTSLDGITRAQRVEGASHYLLEFVRAVGHSLENFDLVSLSKCRSPGRRPRACAGLRPIQAMRRSASSIVCWSATSSLAYRPGIRGRRSRRRCIARWARLRAFGFVEVRARRSRLPVETI
jgi:hypothetical protein